MLLKLISVFFSSLMVNPFLTELPIDLAIPAMWTSEGTATERSIAESHSIFQINYHEEVGDMTKVMRADDLRRKPRQALEINPSR